MLRIFTAITLLASTALAGPEFRTDVMPVLSKMGCNLGACHGNGNGKGGFRLSLRGQDPDLDWQSIVGEYGGRRVNLIEPEQSLLLQKAAASIAHEGGQRFKADSPEYAILLDWLRAGALDSGADKKLTALEVSPLERYTTDANVQLRAVAKFADGTERDVTRLAVFEPNILGVHASLDGLITPERRGEVTVLVRYLDKQIPVHLVFLPEHKDFTFSPPPPANFVDEMVFGKLKALQMNPSTDCGDEVFLRRAYLDLLGVTPSAETARAFVADATPDKRAQLVERLLARGEFADFWALKWADLLKIEERQLDPKGMAVFHGWIRQSIADNMPMDRFAAAILGARGSTYENPPANWWRANRDPVSRAQNTARVFLGTQINCAQCHNHPFERWTQDDYYSWTAVFARVDYEILENKRKDTNDTREFKGDQRVRITGNATVINARTGQPAAMRFLGAAPPEVNKDRDELQALAEWLPHTQQFSRMQVNRVWFHLFGRGLVEPLDDFRASNPPAHPALLDRLAREFQEHGYDLRWLIRTLMSSRLYALSAVPTETNGADEMNFSHGIVRRLTAEQLMDSISKSLDAPLEIKGFPTGTRLAQVPEGKKHYHPIDTNTERMAAVFGKPPRLVASECERTNEPAMPQVFQLLSGPTLQNLLTQKGNVLDQLLGNEESDSQRIEQLFWNMLSRPPSQDEHVKFSDHLRKAADRRKALEDLAWALVNSKEFLFRR